MNQRSKPRSNEQGSAMLLSIAVLMVLGLAILNALHEQLSGALALTHNEHRYLLAWEQASSSLSWGLAQKWRQPDNLQWHCVQNNRLQKNTGIIAVKSSGLLSCARAASRPDVFIVKGIGEITANLPAIELFQRAIWRAEAGGVGTFIPLKQGWLDFCPEPDERYCEPTKS